MRTPDRSPRAALGRASTPRWRTSRERTRRPVSRCWHGAGRSPLGLSAGRRSCVLDSGTAGCPCIACAARGHLEVPASRWAVVAIAHVDVRRRGDDGAGPVAPLPVGYLALVRDESDLDGVSGQGPPAFREFRLGTAGVAS